MTDGTMYHGDGAEDTTMATVTMSGTAQTHQSLTSEVVLVIDSIGDAVYLQQRRDAAPYL